MRWTMFFVAAVACIGTLAVAARQETGAAKTAKAAVKAEPELRVPGVNYRKDWVQLGSFSVLSDKPVEGAKELHVVFSERENVERYLKDKSFPDGAVLVKDVYEAATEELTTGTASFAGKLKGRFVMVKDSNDRYAGTSPRWGDGWGWAFYEGSERLMTVTQDYRHACIHCHEPARSQDFLFLQGYPVLNSSAH